MSMPVPRPEPGPPPVPPPIPEPFPPKPVREPDPGYLPDEDPLPNPDESENPPKRAGYALPPGWPRMAVTHLPQRGTNMALSLMFRCGRP